MINILKICPTLLMMVTIKLTTVIMLSLLTMLPNIWLSSVCTSTWDMLGRVLMLSNTASPRQHSWGLVWWVARGTASALQPSWCIPFCHAVCFNFSPVVLQWHFLLSLIYIFSLFAKSINKFLSFFFVVVIKILQNNPSMSSKPNANCQIIYFTFLDVPNTALS